MTVFSLWLDQTNAEEEIRNRAGDDAQLADVARQIIENGFCVLDEMAEPALLDEIVADYYRWLEDNTPLAEKHQDGGGRHFRLTNLHVYSEAAQRVVKDDRVMRVLDFIFGARTMVYTSLTFEYSTEQRPHRDTPHFYTLPEGLFLGVWFALEDIHPDAGPLTYYPGSHRISVDQTRFLEGGDCADEGLRHEAISRYQTAMREESERISALKTAVLKRGQMAIWHPQLVHGGSKQKNGSLTRRSMVFHVAPESVPVFKNDVFFGLPPATMTPYSKVLTHGRYHAYREKPSFMGSR